MSTSIITSLDFAGKLIVIYGGIIVFISGIVGDILNILVFLSLRTFRQNSCALFLTIMSMVNIGQLCTNVLLRIMTSQYGSDGTDLSVLYCKLRFFFSQSCTVISLTCFCLATIDQYCATSSRPCLQRLCNIKLAKRILIILVFLWILHGIPYIVFLNHVTSSSTGKVSCNVTDFIYLQYRTYVVILIFLGILPILITVLFGSMAYYNVQQIAYYTIPLVRRELDKQLTVMVLVQVLMNFFVLLPYTIVNALTINTVLNSDPIIRARIQLSSNISIILYYTYLANPFYIYICVSERFRRQLIYVLSKILSKKFNRQPRSLSSHMCDLYLSRRCSNAEISEYWSSKIRPEQYVLFNLSSLINQKQYFIFNNNNNSQSTSSFDQTIDMIINDFEFLSRS